MVRLRYASYPSLVLLVLAGPLTVSITPQSRGRSSELLGMFSKPDSTKLVTKEEPDAPNKEKSDEDVKVRIQTESTAVVVPVLIWTGRKNSRKAIRSRHHRCQPGIHYKHTG